MIHLTRLQSEFFLIILICFLLRKVSRLQFESLGYEEVLFQFAFTDVFNFVHESQSLSQSPLKNGLIPSSKLWQQFWLTVTTRSLVKIFIQFRLRSSHLQMFLKIGVIKTFSIFTEKHLCWSLLPINLKTKGLHLYKKEPATQQFSCEYCKIFKNSFFIGHLRWLLCRLPLKEIYLFLIY